jgi:hypothetical protein
VGHCYDSEPKQQSYLFTSTEIEAGPAEHQTPDCVVTVHQEFILPGQTVIAGRFRISEVGSPPKTSGTMVEPELTHSKWQWNVANRFVTAAVFSH